MILTYQEIEALQELELSQQDYLAHFAYAVEAAVLSKLAAGVSVDDLEFDIDHAGRKVFHRADVETAIAAARVQTLNEVLRLLVAGKQFKAADAIRALKEST